MGNIERIFLQKVEEFGRFEGCSGGDPINLSTPLDPPIPVSDKGIVEIEKELGANLPEDYKEFLTFLGGGWFPGYPGTRPIEIRGNYAHEIISSFYGSKREKHNRLAEAIACFKDRVPAE